VLVKTIAVLVIAIGAGLLLGGIQERVDPGLIVVALGSAGGLLAVEVVYVIKRVISPIYGLDAVLELGLLVSWAVCLVGL
jgi:hypothetical protein